MELMNYRSNRRFYFRVKVKRIAFICLLMIGLCAVSEAQVKQDVKSSDSLSFIRQKQKELKKELSGKLNINLDTAKADLSRKTGVFIKKKITHLKNTSIGKVSGIRDSLRGDSSLLQRKATAIKDQLKTRLAQKKNLLDSAAKHKKVKLVNLDVENSVLAQTSTPNFAKASVLNNISVFAQVQVFKFPLAIDLSNNSSDFSGIDPIKDALFKVNFDKPQFGQSYKKELDKLAGFKRMQLSGMDIPDYLRKGITEKLRAGSLFQPADFPGLNAVLNNKEQLNALLALNEDQLREKLTVLMSEKQQAVTGKIDSLSADKKQKVQEQVRIKKEEVANTILSLKQKMEESGLDQQRLQLIQNFIANKGSLKDIDAIFKNELNQQGKLSGISKLYAGLKAMQAGNFSQQMPGSFLNRDLMINGFNTVLRTGRGPVNVGFGINKDVGMPKDANFNSSMFDVPKLLTYVSIPTSNFPFGNGKLSWIGAFDRQKNSGLNQLNAFPRNGLAFTVSQNLEMNTAGKFTFEVSKSATQYKNINLAQADKLLLNNDLKMGNYFRDDFTQTLSFGLKHHLELKKFGLYSNTFFSYSGLGYQNPGQPGYGNMGMRLGGNVKKNLLRNQVVLSVRGDLKNTPLGGAAGGHWRNYNLQLDSRIKLFKNYALNLKYQENGVDKVNSLVAPAYSSQKMQADMNTSYKLGGNYAFSYVSIGRQVMLNPSVLTNTSFMTLICSQNIVLKSVSLNANAFYNKELNGLRVLGDLLNADLGCQYTLLKKMNISSSVTYLDNQHIARQLGVRQSIQLSMLKNFDVSAFVDMRRNLINPLYPDLFSTGRGELSIRYYLNK